MISLCQSPLGCSRCRKLRRLFGNNGFNSIEMYNFCCISLTPPSFVLPDIRFRQNGVSYSSAEVAVHFKRNRGLWNRGVRHAHTHTYLVYLISVFSALSTHGANVRSRCGAQGARMHSRRGGVYAGAHSGRRRAQGRKALYARALKVRARTATLLRWRGLGRGLCDYQQLQGVPFLGNTRTHEGRGTAHTPPFEF